MSNKTSLLKIRVTKEDLSFIRAQAESAGLPASTYARALMLGHTMRTGSDAAILNELRELGGQLGSIRGLCKQLKKGLRLRWAARCHAWMAVYCGTR